MLRGASGALHRGRGEAERGLCAGVQCVWRGHDAGRAAMKLGR